MPKVAVDVAGTVNLASGLAVSWGAGVARNIETHRGVLVDEDMAQSEVRQGVAVDSISDDELMARAAQGDEEAFDLVHARHRDRVFRIAYRCVGQRQLAEDITQETFLQVFRHLGRYQPMGQAVAWLARIAVNLSRNALRRRRDPWSQEESSEDGESRLERVADTGASPVDRAASSERDALVRAAIAELPREYREVLVLCSLEGLSYREAAGALNISEKLVGVRLFRGRDRLRALLQQRGALSVDAGEVER